LLERFRVLVWAGGALLGWVAGTSWSRIRRWPAGSRGDLQVLHAWGGRVGAIIVMAAGYMLVRHVVR